MVMFAIILFFILKKLRPMPQNFSFVRLHHPFFIYFANFVTFFENIKFRACLNFIALFFIAV
jgi:hypothetical protein